MMFGGEERVMDVRILDGIVLVPGSLDGVEGCFALDTGATETVLNLAHYDGPADVPADSGITYDRETKVNRVFFAEDASIVLGGEEVPLKRVSVMDMGYVEGPMRGLDEGLTLLGAIGADVIGSGRLLIDYLWDLIIFNPVVIPPGWHQVELSVGTLPTVMVGLSGGTYPFIIDTGANHFVVDPAVAPMDALSPSEEDDGVYVIDSLVFAGWEYSGLTGLVSDLSAIRRHVDAVGIIGYQLLEGRRCCFDYRAGRLYLGRGKRAITSENGGIGPGSSRPRPWRTAPFRRRPVPPGSPSRPFRDDIRARRSDVSRPRPPPPANRSNPPASAP